MSSFLLTTQGSLGDLHPYLALGLGLRNRGHRVAVGTTRYYRDRVEGAGLEFRPIAPHLSPEDESIVKLVVDPDKGSENIFRQLLMPPIRESYANTRAAVEGMDAVVGHPIALATPLVCEQRRLKWASVALAPLSFLSVHEPIEISGHEILSSLTYHAFWIRKLFGRLGRAQSRRWVTPLLEFRKELGLGPGGHPLFEGQHSPHLVLALFTSLLANRQPDWPPHTTVAGYCFYDKKSGHDALNPALVRFLEEGPAPLVFTLGSTAVLDAGSFYEESAAAARTLKKRAVLLCGKTPPRGVDGADLHIAEYAPYSQLFTRAEAVICSGGIGTIGQCLKAGVPFVVVPFGNDQPDNAARCCRLGVSRTLPRKRYRRDRAAETVGALLADPGARTKARDGARVIAQEDGVRVACEALERLVATP
ncbi:MAG: glycosyltransferase [Planctomycetaceae bacterium]|nr:glycosyltransferase [Planctomycetaceae bacterium]